MNDRERKTVLKLVERYRIEQGFADRARMRASWSPGTETSKKELERVEKREDRMLAIYNELMDHLGGEQLEW